MLKDCHVITFGKEKRRLVPLNAIPTGKSTPLANEAMETPPVIIVDVIRPASVTLVNVLNRFIIFCQPFSSIQLIFSSYMFVDLVML